MKSSTQIHFHSKPRTFHQKKKWSGYLSNCFLQSSLVSIYIGEFSESPMSYVDTSIFPVFYFTVDVTIQNPVNNVSTVASKCNSQPTKLSLLTRTPNGILNAFDCASFKSTEEFCSSFKRFPFFYSKNVSKQECFCLMM